MIYIYSHTVTNRLKYTLNVLFKNILQVDYKLVDKETFEENSIYPKINYSDEIVTDCIWIKPHPLLFETDIKPQDIAVTYKNEIPYFFKTSKKAVFQFDIFASSFYMLSRYEEYLAFIPDVHGRFTAEQSLAFKTNFFQKPVVHLWARQVRDEILKQTPDYLFSTRIFTQLNTVDIDIAYAYKGKSFTRRWGSLIKAMFHFNIKEISQHFSFILTRKDPYDTYAILEKAQEQSNAENTYFFQVGNYGTHDKNLAINNVMLNLITKISENAAIGLHPSYASNTDFVELLNEYQNLSEIIGKPITKSRQHYLKLSFPETYENLIRLGVEQDYTLGFSDKIGFRAGMALPYAFFNLRTNKERPLTIVPFQIMDGTLKDYLQLSPKEAIDEIRQIKSEIRAINGQFGSVFHNSSLTDKGEWEGWLAVYREVLS